MSLYSEVILTFILPSKNKEALPLWPLKNK